VVLERLRVSQLPLHIIPTGADLESFRYLVHTGQIDAAVRNGNEFVVKSILPFGAATIPVAPKKTNWAMLSVLIALSSFAAFALWKLTDWLVEQAQK